MNLVSSLPSANIHFFSHLKKVTSQTFVQTEKFNLFLEVQNFKLLERL